MTYRVSDSIKIPVRKSATTYADFSVRAVSADCVFLEARPTVRGVEYRVSGHLYDREGFDAMLRASLKDGRRWDERSEDERFAELRGRIDADLDAGKAAYFHGSQSYVVRADKVDRYVVLRDLSFGDIFRKGVPSDSARETVRDLVREAVETLFSDPALAADLRSKRDERNRDALLAAAREAKHDVGKSLASLRASLSAARKAFEDAPDGSVDRDDVLNVEHLIDVLLPFETFAAEAVEGDR